MQTGQRHRGAWPHQSKALSAEEEAAGYVLTCCGVAQSDVVIESRQVTEAGALPIKKMPVRVSSLERASHDVMVLRLQLPAADTFQYQRRPIRGIPAARR